MTVQPRYPCLVVEYADLPDGRFFFLVCTRCMKTIATWPLKFDDNTVEFDVIWLVAENHRLYRHADQQVSRK